MSAKKKCQRCKASKNLSEFHKNRSREDGLDFYCSPCRIEYNRERQEERSLESYSSEKRCARCSETKDINQFYRNKYQHDGHDYYCKLCRRKYHREWKLKQY